MPKLPTVRCPGCDKVNPDRGRGQTCERCGLSPLPSREYPEGTIKHWKGE